MDGLLQLAGSERLFDKHIIAEQLVEFLARARGIARHENNAIPRVAAQCLDDQLRATSAGHDNIGQNDVKRVILFGCT